MRAIKTLILMQMIIFMTKDGGQPWQKITDKTGRIAFIGGGMMAEAILKGMLHKEIAEPEMIIISDPSAGRREYLEKTLQS